MGQMRGNGSSSPFVCGGSGPWSLFVLVSARLFLVVLLVIGGPSVVGGDGAHSSMCMDGGGGRYRSSVVVVGSTSELAKAVLVRGS